MNKVIAIVGPTAVGKTALSIKLAHEFDGEVISGDSMQVYRRLDIGTAKVTPEEMGDVPHHLIDTFFLFPALLGTACKKHGLVIQYDLVVLVKYPLDLFRRPNAVIQIIQIGFLTVHILNGLGHGAQIVFRQCL